MSASGVAIAQAVRLDGVAIAGEIKAEVAADVLRLREQGIVPGLAVVLAGHVPASEIYVRNKVKTCGELGIHSETDRRRTRVGDDRASCWRWSTT